MSLHRLTVEVHTNDTNRIERILSSMKQHYNPSSSVSKSIEQIEFHLEGLIDDLHDVLRLEV